MQCPEKNRLYAKTLWSSASRSKVHCSLDSMFFLSFAEVVWIPNHIWTVMGVNQALEFLWFEFCLPPGMKYFIHAVSLSVRRYFGSRKQKGTEAQRKFAQYHFLQVQIYLHVHYIHPCGILQPHHRAAVAALHVPAYIRTHRFVMTLTTLFPALLLTYTQKTVSKMNHTHTADVLCSKSRTHFEECRQSTANNPKKSREGMHSVFLSIWQCFTVEH